jgi:FkbM family methyltransferase
MGIKEKHITGNRIHKFENGIKVYDNQLLDIQRERYLKVNVHEAVEENVFIEYINRIRASGTFINVGSAIGYYLFLAKLKRPDIKVIGYEPLRLHRKYFYRNVLLNNFRESDFKLFPEGLHYEKRWNLLKNRRFGSLIETSKVIKICNFFKYMFSKKYTLIKTVTLNEIIQRSDGIIDLLQMDIQGIEYNILNNSKEILMKGFIKCFIIGTHGSEIHQGSLDVLQYCNYNISYNEPFPVGQPDGIIVAEFND